MARGRGRLEVDDVDCSKKGLGDEGEFRDLWVCRLVAYNDMTPGPRSRIIKLGL